MQNPQVVTHFFIPTDQHTPEAIHPAMRALHAPPPCFEPHLGLQGLGRLAPRSDMCREPELLQQVAHLVVVIALVQPPPLGGVRGGSGPFHGQALDGRARQLEIIPLRAGPGQTERHATAVWKDAAFGAVFAAFRGILALLFPPPRAAWVIAPSIASPAQARPCKASDS